VTFTIFIVDRLIFVSKPLSDSEKMSLKIDFINGFIELFNFRRGLGTILTIGLVTVAEKGSYIYSFKLLDHLKDFPIVQMIVFIVTYDFAYYWYHRLRHHSSIWPIHGYHHSSTYLNPMTNLRFHALNHPMFVFFFAFPYYSLFGPEIMPTIYFVLFSYIPSSIAHSHWDTDFGWLGRYFIVSPRFHRLHHSDNPIYANSNFGGLVFVWWDHLFGTYKDPSFAFQESTGINPNFAERDGFFRGYIATIKVLFNSLKKHTLGTTPSRGD
jgi:sterol desaturase/sphingolipid hydroxylase (fatty acid hydroxylase superfamily)